MRLRETGTAEPDLDARLIVAEALGLDGAGLIRDGGRRVAAESRARVEALLARRAGGEPVHRILGHRAFYAHDFRLSADTLEPRPDTETLVELCREPIAECIRRKGRCTFADIGTGTGAIAVSLLALFPEAQAVATDIAPGALKMAEANAAAAGVSGRFRARHGDHLAALDGPVDLVASNPPYIPSGAIAGLARDVRLFDPRLALDGGPDGLASFRAIAGGAASVLEPGGAVAVEIGIGQEELVTAIFAARGFTLAQAAPDLSGTTRALLFHEAKKDATDRRQAAGTVGDSPFLDKKDL